MKKSIIILWIATILSIVFLSLTQRYAVTMAGGGVPYAYKLDKLTGRVWMVQGILDQILVPNAKVKPTNEKKR